VNDPASLPGDARLRLFCALTLPETVLDALAAWQPELRGHGARVVVRANLHVTLAFLGLRHAADLAAITGELRVAAGALERVPELSVVRYRETRSVGMLVLADDGHRAAKLASDVHERLERLGVYTREARAWLPHITVLRFRAPPRLAPSLPDLPPFSPSEAAVYHSMLRSGGAQYEIVESVRLGG
jgi:2'-5' RNA ligase